MKKLFIVLFGILCLGMSQAQAQYISFNKGHVSDETGAVLNDDQILQLIGSQIYDETYVGAMKQLKVGKRLITWGAVGAGVGVATAVACAVTGDWYSHLSEEEYVFTNSEKMLMAGYVGGIIVAALGGTALDVGIPFACIGKSRLNWIAENYNETAKKTVALRVTGCSVGTGLGVAIVF